MRLGRKKRSGRLVAAVAALVAVPALLLGAPAGVAYAAAAAPQAARAATGSTTAGDTARTDAAAGRVLAQHRGPAKPVTRPVSPPANHGTTVSRAEAGKLAAAAVRAARRRPQVTNGCSGPLAPDGVQACTSDTSGTDTYTVTVPDAVDVLVVQAESSGFGGEGLPVSVTDPDGAPVTCAQPQWYMEPACATTRAGTYTLHVQNPGSDYTVSYTALLSDDSCQAMDTSFDSGAAQISVAAGSVGQCFTLDAAPGDVLRVAFSGENTFETVYDATGTQVCFGNLDCALTGTGPYRAIAGDTEAQAQTFSYLAKSLTQPQGCLAQPQLTYGQAPDQSSADRCRTLTVATADRYQVFGASGTDGTENGTLYHPDGTQACTNNGSTCDLTPGTYDFVANEDPSLDADFGLVFLAADESQGCVATGDTDFADGPATGTFSGAGEEVCLTLPTASGASDYILDQPAASGDEAQVQLLDSTGAQQCPNADFDYATCALTGTAPFHLVTFGPAAGGGYQVLVQRTDSTAGCGAWPQSGFGGSYGAQVSLPADDLAACLTIPADGHSTGEMIDYTNDTNTVDGAIYVNDPTGKQICSGATSAVCSYTTGVPYTALLIGVGGADTYKVVRRDVSATADCAAPASTTVGGQATAMELSSALDSECVRISGQSTDWWWAAARSDAASPAGAVLQVTDATGKIVCWQSGPSCRLSGASAYQLVVTADNYAGTTIPAYLDTWRVATASGWAPECQAHALSANGFAPFSGSLTESAAGYCAVVDESSQTFGVYGTSTAAYPGVPDVLAFGPTGWSGYGGCNNLNYGSFAYSCQPPAGEDLLIVAPYQSTLPVDYTMQGVCTSGCATPPAATTVTSVSPATGASGGPVQAVLHGTGLNLADEPSLSVDGSAAAYGTVVSVSADGTQLTVAFDLSGVAPGGYDVDVRTPAFSTVQLTGGYTVTAGPTTAARAIAG